MARYGYAVSTTTAKSGRDGGIRTHDPLTPSQVRYQAAPHPDKAIVLIVSLKADTTFPRPTVRLEPDTTY